MAYGPASAYAYVANERMKTLAEERQRQKKWDIRFLKMAQMVSTWSKDPSTQTGAVIIRPDKSVCSVGFNGFPMGTDDNPEIYADRETKYQKIVHCEMNAHAFARERVDGYTLYTWPFFSCDRCCAHMLQYGITRLVSPECPEHLLERWQPTFDRAWAWCKEKGVPYELIKLEEINELG
jgi:dCMP deaminase